MRCRSPLPFSRYPGRLWTILFLAVVMAGCQGIGGGAIPPSSSGAGQAATLGAEEAEAALRHRIESGDLDGAVSLYRTHKGKVETGRPTVEALVARLAAYVNGRDEPTLKRRLEALQRVSWPAPAVQWPDVRAAVVGARDALAAYHGTGLFDDPERVSVAAETLARTLDDLKARILADLDARRTAYRAADGRPFDSVYPVVPDSGLPPTHAEMESALADADPARIRAYAEGLGADALDDSTKRVLGDLYVAAWPREAGLGKRSGLLAALLARGAAEEAGLAPTPTDAAPIGLVEATSQTLLRHGQIDFPASIEVDLPVETRRMDLDAPWSDGDGTAPRYVIVFDVALAKASRRVLNLKEVPSVAFLGYDYGGRTVRADELQAISGRSGPAPSHASLPGSMQVFGGKSIGEPVFVRYTFSKAAIQARKNMTAHYTVIDRKRRSYYRSTFDVAEEMRFEVAYNIADSDTRKSEHKKEYDSEKDVDDFEKEPATVRLSQLLKDYLAHAGKHRAYRGLEALRREILRDKNQALAKYEANRFDARPLNDPRFDSVVAVYRGSGAMGAGFYVTPDVVMTNWHVVEDVKFVEMKTYDGRETFGSVLGKDARIDVALVKVQRKGKPVRFHSGRDLDLGATVEAIGHPHRFEFSVTRGVVSAVRKHPSINLPKGAGDEVLYIQTDAPINPGNSGGPLFLGDHVVGMNTWGYVASYADNLGFAVHYAELLAFLDEHLPGHHVLASGEPK